MTSQNGTPVSLSVKISYALPTMPVYFMGAPLFVVQGLYAKHFGLELTTIAVILLVARLFDAATDPVIGYYSDRHYDHCGSRKAFVVAGSLLMTVASYHLFVPLDIGTLRSMESEQLVLPKVSSGYFLGWFLVFYLAWTLFEIPHLAWGGELVSNSGEKNSIYGLRFLAGNTGILFFYLIPLSPYFASSAYTPQTLHWVVLIAGSVMLPSLYASVKSTPNGSRLRTSKSQQSSYIPCYVLLREIVNNKPLLWFLAAYFLSGAGGGMWFTMQFIFIDSYLEMGEHFALSNVIGLILGGLLMISIWVSLATYGGKKIVWCSGVVVYASGIFIAGLLKPGETTLIQLVVVTTLYYGGFAALGVMAPSVLSDIIDYSTWKFGVDRAAIYFALKALFVKSSLSFGGALGLGLAGLYGFDPGSTTHSSEQVFGLRFAASWLPTFILLTSVVLIAYIPINSRRQRIVSRRLKSKVDASSQLPK